VLVRHARAERRAVVVRAGAEGLAEAVEVLPRAGRAPGLRGLDPEHAVERGIGAGGPEDAEDETLERVLRPPARRVVCVREDHGACRSLDDRAAAPAMDPGMRAERRYTPPPMEAQAIGEWTPIVRAD